MNISKRTIQVSGQLHARLPGANLCVLSGTNHFCMFERPREFNQALLAFLQEQITPHKRI